MSDEQPEKKPKKSSIHPSINKKQLEESRKRRKKLEEKREVLFTFGDNDQYSVIKAGCYKCGQEFSYIKEDVEKPPTVHFKRKLRTIWHTLCKACLDEFVMKERLKKFFEEGDYTIVESKCKDCEQRFWYIVRNPVGIVGEKLNLDSLYRPRFEKLCQPCSKKFREADYEDDDDDEDDWWKKGK